MKIEDIFQVDLFGRLQQPALGAFSDDIGQLRRGGQPLRGADRRQVNQPQDSIAGPVEQRGQRQKEASAVRHRAIQPHSRQRRILQRQRLWRHFTHHDVQVSQHADGDHRGDRMRRRHRQPTGSLQRAQNPGGHDMFAVHAKPQAGQGDADLSGGNIAVQFARRAQGVEHALRRGHALLRELLDPRPRHGGNAELGADEQSVEEDKYGDHRQGK